MTPPPPPPADKKRAEEDIKELDAKNKITADMVSQCVCVLEGKVGGTLFLAALPEGEEALPW